MPDGGKLIIRTANVTARGVAGPRPASRAARRLCPDRGHRHRQRHAPGDAARSSSRSSPPRRSDRARASASPPSTASSSRPAASSSPRASWARARSSASICRAVEVAQDRAARSKPPRRSAEDHTGRGTILLVEDEDAVRSFAARALGTRGYRARGGGRRGSARAVHEHDGEIDLLISDVVMPGIDGPTLVKAVRAERPEMQDHLHLGLCRGRLPQGALRRRGSHFPAEALQPQAAHHQGERRAGGPTKPARIERGNRED